MRERNRRIVKQLIPLAIENSDDRLTSTHAAAIYKKKRRISVGFNKMKTHTLMHSFCKNPEAIFLHAEIDAISKARCDLEGATMYVIRVSKDGRLAGSKPCSGCMRAIKYHGIKEVIYSDGIGVECQALA